MIMAVGVILLRSESRAACAQSFALCLTQQSRSRAVITLLLLVRATYIWVLFFTHIPFVVNRAFNLTTAESSQQQYCSEAVSLILPHMGDLTRKPPGCIRYPGKMQL